MSKMAHHHHVAVRLLLLCCFVAYACQSIVARSSQHKQHRSHQIAQQPVQSHERQVAQQQQEDIGIDWIHVDQPPQPDLSIFKTRSHNAYVPRIDRLQIAVNADDAPVLSISPAVLDQPSMTVRVSWNFTAAQLYDWIAVYSPVPPSLDDYANVFPVKYFNLTNVTADGHVDLFMLNRREDSIFAYMRGGWEAPTLLGLSQVMPITIAMKKQPMSVHLMRTIDPSEVKVVWTTTSENITAQQPVVVVSQIGSLNDFPQRKLPQNWHRSLRHQRRATQARTIAANTTTYTAADMCGGNAVSAGFRDPGAIHAAIIDSLVENGIYSYHVADAGNGATSDEFVFVAPMRTPSSPSSSSSSQPTTFIIAGDLGQAEFDGAIEWQEWTRDIFNRSFGAIDQPAALQTMMSIAQDMQDGTLPAQSLVFIIGDVTYTRGHAAMMDQFLYLMQPISTTMPTMTLLGNHDIDWELSFIPGHDSGGECGLAYQAHFPMPQAAGVSSEEYDRVYPNKGFKGVPFYSFDHGVVHFVAMSSEHDFSTGSTQWTWLQNDLATVDRSRTQWVAVALHRPFYVSSADWDGTATDMGVAALLRLHVEPLLNKYNVDAVFAGHHHDFQRTCVVYNETCVQRVGGYWWDAGVSDYTPMNNTSPDPQPANHGTVHFLTGAAGQWNDMPRSNWSLTWIEVMDDHAHGYSRVTANETTMTVDYIASVDRTMWDSVTLVKDPQGGPVTVVRNPSASYQPSHRSTPSVNAAVDDEVLLTPQQADAAKIFSE